MQRVAIKLQAHHSTRIAFVSSLYPRPRATLTATSTHLRHLRRLMASTKVMLLLVLGLLLSSAPGTLAKKGKAETIDSKFQPGEGGVAERTVPLRTHSIYAPYVDSDLQNRWFDFGGSTIINTNKHIRLTQDRKSQAGWLWSRLPLTPASFEVEWEFKVDGSSNSLFGDGFAMWLTKERAQFGPVYGSSDRWEGLGVFFDTYANARHSYSFPSIMGMLNDGTKSYDNNKDGAGQEAGRCSIDFRRTEVTAKGKLTYFKDNFLQLQIQHEEWDKWETCFTIPKVTLPGVIYLGFSAHTGDVSDNHDIISISTHNVVWHPPNENYVPKARTRTRSQIYSSKTGGSSALGLIFSIVKWLFLAVLVVVAAIAFMSWRSKKRAKRF